MLTRIVQPSPTLESVLGSLHLGLSQPQRDHLLQLVDGLSGSSATVHVLPIPICHFP